MTAEPGETFVSRGGTKLAAALDAFGLDVAGAVGADLGCNVGGFVDCLLQRGARRVYAVDTGYGELAWKLRQDERVVVMERTNALHMEPAGRGIGLVTIDLGWTRQARAIPAALAWEPAHIISLVKPHYESPPAKVKGRRGVLSDEEADRVLPETLHAMPALGVEVLDWLQSPIRGGAGKGRRGNVEYLALLRSTLGNP